LRKLLMLSSARSPIAWCSTVSPKFALWLKARSDIGLRYRRHLLSIKHYFARHGATVILLDDLTAEVGDKTAHSVAHGVIQLEELAPAYGAERHRMRVLKYRGQKYRGGYHDFTIHAG
jgi:circadian clock protein KaiC